MTKDEIVDTLNDLIQITEDSHEGYRKSAEDAEEQDLKSLFNDLSAYRKAIVAGEPALMNSALGAALVLSGTPIYFYYRWKKLRNLSP